jgi:hypothetical protein
MLFKEMIAVYIDCENRIRPINTKCVDMIITERDM